MPASKISLGEGLRARVPALVAFCGGVALVLIYALPGGAYDIVVRQEYGIVVWWILGLGYATGVLPRMLPARVSWALPALLLAYAGWTALSLGWSPSSERTTAELARILDYLGLVVLIASCLDTRTWRPALMGVGMGAMLVCALAVISRLDPSAFPAVTINPSRLSYPFGYWNAVGAWGSMSIALGLAWSAHDSSRLRRAVALGMVPVAAVATYLAYSRAAVGGTVLAGALVLAFSRYRLVAFLHIAAAAAGSAIAIVAVRGAPQIAHGTGSHGSGAVIGATVFGAALAASVGVLSTLGKVDRARLPRRPARVAGVAALIVVVALGASFGPRIVSNAWHQFRQTPTAQSSNPSARLTQLSSTRYQVWRTAIHAFTSHPITGIGAGAFEFWWDRHGSDSEFVRNTHSFELENMAELGAPGLALIVAIMVAAVAVLVSLRRRARRTLSAGASVAMIAAFGVYLAQASVDWLWQSTAVTVLALAGVAAASVRSSRPMSTLDWRWRSAIPIAAIGAVALQLPGLLSTAELRRSQAAERVGNGPVALSWANAAVNSEPWSASAYEQRGLVLEAGGRLDAAAADLRRAIDHERTNFRHWLILARIETERGQIVAAVRDYNEAHQLRPKAYVFSFGFTLRTTPTH